MTKPGLKGTMEKLPEPSCLEPLLARSKGATYADNVCRPPIAPTGCIGVGGDLEGQTLAQGM